MDVNGNGHVEVDGLEYYNLEFFYIDENEDEVILLETHVAANCGAVEYVKLIGNKVFTYGSDTMEPGYSLISKTDPGKTDQVTFTDGSLRIEKSGGSKDWFTYGFIPFIKQAGMQTLQFKWSFTFNNSGYRYVRIYMGVQNNDLVDTNFISTAYVINNAAQDAVTNVINGTSIASLTDGNLYYIKFCMAFPSSGYTVALKINDIWFE